MLKIANAPCSWGALEFGMSGKTAAYDTVLDEISLTGYTGTELGDWGFMPTDPLRLKAELSRRQLDLAGAFVPVRFLSETDYKSGTEMALKTARLLRDANHPDAKIVLSDDNGKNSVRTQNAGRIQPHQSLSLPEWKVYSERVNELARRILNETGVTTTFHHHCAGYVETPEEIATLMELTDPELVSLCFDTGHYAFGGGDPVAGLKSLGERIGHVHFKDWDPVVFQDTKENNRDYFEAVGNGIFCELGNGSVDFKAVLEELKQRSYTGWIVVEQDILPGMGTPKESALRNREFLRLAGA